MHGSLHGFVGAITAVMLSLPLSAQIATKGYWEAPFDHEGPKINLPDDTGRVWPGDPFVPANGFGTPLTVHLALIPCGLDRGKVIMMGHFHYPVDPDPANPTVKKAHRYAIVDPTLPSFPAVHPAKFENYTFLFPLGEGDLFCSGHAWMPDGNLMVTGGALQHPHGDPEPNPASGARLFYFWNPVDNSWNRPPDPLDKDLAVGRWYPTVTLLPPDGDGRDLVLITGGKDTANLQNYEAWVMPFSFLNRPAWEGNWQIFQPPPPLAPTRIWEGPGGGSDYRFEQYPRVHALTDGRIVTTGFRPGMSRRLHSTLVTQNWETLGIQSPTPVLSTVQRSYNTSVLFPELPGLGANVVMSIGGATGAWQETKPHRQTTASVEISRADAVGPGPFPTGSDWTHLPDMAYPRVFPNAVLLPDSTVLVMGGDQVGQEFGTPSNDPAMVPELFENGTWRSLAPMTRARSYHSTAMLLPSGKVLVAGGNSRRFDPATGSPLPTTEQADYEVYVPPYIASGETRPVITNLTVANTLNITYGSQFTIEFANLPFGTSIGGAVLMAPGSTTHHSDMSQRLVKLPIVSIHIGGDEGEGGGDVPSDSHAIVTSPSAYTVPRGYYMLFLVTTDGIPSKARWVKLQ